MPRFIMKANREDDLYVEWSTVVDNIVWTGTREELTKHGEFSGWFTGSSQLADIEARIARTDETGTSARFFDTDPQEGAWDDPYLLVTNDPVMDDGYYRLDRDDLGDYARGDHTVLQPLPDED